MIKVPLSSGASLAHDRAVDVTVTPVYERKMILRIMLRLMRLAHDLRAESRRSYEGDKRIGAGRFHCLPGSASVSR